VIVDHSHHPIECGRRIERAYRRFAGRRVAPKTQLSETIHEAVLAVKLRTPLSALADTIHAFPTVARVFGSVVAAAHRALEAGDAHPS
jgi:hypothetical protein